MILHDGRQSPRLAPNRPYMSHPKRADFALTLSPPPPLRCRTTTYKISPNGQAPHTSTILSHLIYIDSPSTPSPLVSLSFLKH